MLFREKEIGSISNLNSVTCFPLWVQLGPFVNNSNCRGAKKGYAAVGTVLGAAEIAGHIVGLQSISEISSRRLIQAALTSIEDALPAENSSREQSWHLWLRGHNSLATPQGQSPLGAALLVPVCLGARLLLACGCAPVGVPDRAPMFQVSRFPSKAPKPPQ